MSEQPIEFIIKLRGGQQAAADAKLVDKAISGVGGTMKRVGDSSVAEGKRISAFGGGLKRVALGLGAIGAGYASWSAAKSAITYTTDLAKSTNVLSKATGMSVGQTSSLIAVSGALGVESNKLGMLFVKLGKATIAQAESTGKHKTAFDRLGISQVEARAHLNDTAGMLDIVTHKLATEHVPAAQKAALMTELFGRGWQTLAPLLLEGSTGFGKLTKMAKEFGLELGGNGAESLKKFHEQQVESKLAMEGMQVSFTKLVAGPLGGMLSGFARLTVFARKGQWGEFDKEVGRIGQGFSTLAEKVLPKVAASFAHIAPAVLEAFWKGFVNAPLGAQLLMAGVLATKMGLTGGIFAGIGRGLGGKLAGGVESQAGSMGGVGGRWGGVFGKAFIAGAIGVGIYSFLKNTSSERPLEEAWHSITGEPNKLDSKREQSAASMAAERAAFLKRHHAPTPHTKPFGSNIRDPGLRHAAERYARAHHLPGAALGANTLTAGSLLVGERGPEILNMPAAAQIKPLAPGSLADNRPIILKVDGRVLARVNRREARESQAAGA